MLAHGTAAFIVAGTLLAPVLPTGAEGAQGRREAAQGQQDPVNDYDVGPKATRTTLPVYPKAAQETGVEGTVLLEILINTKGRVVRTRVVESIPELDAAAVACVKQWRYIPAQKNGRPVPAKAFAVITFKREGKPEVSVA
jgi:TonB family protein